MQLTKDELKGIWVTNRKLTQTDYHNLFDSILFNTAGSGGADFNADTLHSHSISGIIGLPQTLSLKADLVDGLIPASQLPSYVDDIIEFDNFDSFPVTGEFSKIYIAIDTNFTYRWSGTDYITLGTKSKYTKITEATSGVAGEKYIADTSLGSFNLYLPVGVEGATIEVWDFNGTWETNFLTLVAVSGEKINGLPESMNLDISNAKVGLVYTDSIRGWQIDIGGNFLARGNDAVLQTYFKISMDTNGIAGAKYIADTSLESFNFYLPVGVEGNTIEVWDFDGTWGTNNLSIIPASGEKINGVAEILYLDISNAKLTFVYTDNTRGWQIDIGGNFLVSGNGGLETYFKISTPIDAEPNRKYIVDTEFIPITVTLPIGTEGDTITFWDYNGFWSTNNLTIAPSFGEKISGSDEHLILNMADAKVELVYTDSIKGWQIDIGGIRGIQGPPGTSINIENDTTTNTLYFPTFSTEVTGSQFKVSNSKLTFNPYNGTLSALVFSGASDEKLKCNIHPINNSLDIVKKITGKEFNWKETGIKSYGFIAQELELILPELVTENSSGMKGVNYMATIAILLESIKTLSERVEALESR